LVVGHSQVEKDFHVVEGFVVRKMKWLLWKEEKRGESRSRDLEVD